MHERHLAVRIPFAYRFQTAGDIYVIFWELLIVTSLLLLLLELRSLLCAYLFLFVVSSQQLLNPLAHFSHILQRKVEFVGIVSCSHHPENRRGEKHSLYVRESVLYVSFSESTGRKLSFTASPRHGLPSL